MHSHGGEVVAKALECHFRHSREGGNPLRAMDPRLRGDDDWVFFCPFATASGPWEREA